MPEKHSPGVSIEDGAVKVGQNFDARCICHVRVMCVGYVWRTRG